MQALATNQTTFSQTEKIIYGSQRLGMRVDTVEVQSATMPGLERPFIAGNTRYELSNHLGNVLTTISGKRLAHGPDSGTATHYTTPVLSASDYSPFGAPLHGRTWSGGYRYGFNGMEKDDEVKGSGNSYTTHFRHYDPRLGRWYSIDPRAGIFHWQSPFVGIDNNPIVKGDPAGDCTICYQLEEHGVIVDREIFVRDLLFMGDRTQVKVTGASEYSPSTFRKNLHDIITGGVLEVNKVSERTISSSVTILKNKREVSIVKTTITTTVEFHGLDVSSVTQTTKRESIILGITEAEEGVYRLDLEIPLVDIVRTSETSKNLEIDEMTTSMKEFVNKTQKENQKRYENHSPTIDNTERMKGIESNFKNAK